jgi:uncharacterized protein (DUF1800 family)
MATEHNPWEPFEPSADDPWDQAKVAHLHRRAGFGGTHAELERDLKEGPPASIERFLNPRKPTSEETQIVESLKQGVLESRDDERSKAWWLYRFLYDPDPLREKMTFFWHSHFATSNRKVENAALMLQQNETLRLHALDDFGTLLTAIISDPAMLVWLDGNKNRREKPNENFAREFLELFTLGVGHFAERDVREAARAFTGWTTVRGDSGRLGPPPIYAFDAEKYDDGPKTFLGSSGRWNATDIVRMVLNQPATAEFLCRKLYRFFVREIQEPTDELIKPLAQELRAHQYSIRHILDVILRSRHFYDRIVHCQRIKSPVEWSVALCKTLEVPRDNINLLALAAACERQGQDLFHPPNVKGWDGGKTWLTSATVLARTNWANDVIWGNADLGLKPYDPLAWASRHGIKPKNAATAFVDLMLQNDVDPDRRALLLKTGADGKGNSLRKALQLIVHCPEYQLA